MHPFLILLVGMATILTAIIVVRMNAFLALVLAAILVSLLAPGEAAVKITRVAEGFGRTAGSIGIVIALAAIIGKAMTDSGAADRIVQAFLALLGERRGAAALCATGFLLSIPVFFDTVFYLLVPLARSMHGRTDRHYLRYILAICAGGAATHTLVPPTPGPLAVAGTLGVDLGMMVLVGTAVAIPAATMGLLFAGWADRRMPVRPRLDDAPNAAPVLAPGDRPAAPPASLPGLLPSVLPIILPVTLISSNTLVASMRAGDRPHAPIWDTLAPYTTNLGNPNFALLLSAAFAMWLYARRRRPDGESLGGLVESSLMSAGVIILITAAGGAFGAALQAARLGPAIEALFAGRSAGAGLVFLPLAFAVSSLLKIAQGSSTVAMITTAGMLAAMVGGGAGGASVLPFHPVYVATAIASGALVVSWMNDSGFWVVSKMGGLTEVQTLKTWTPTAAVVGVTAMLVTVALAVLVPLR